MFARQPSYCYALGGGVTGRKLSALSGNVGSGSAGDGMLSWEGFGSELPGLCWDFGEITALPLLRKFVALT